MVENIRAEIKYEDAFSLIGDGRIDRHMDSHSDNMFLKGYPSEAKTAPKNCN